MAPGDGVRMFTRGQPGGGVRGVGTGAGWPQISCIVILHRGGAVGSGDGGQIVEEGVLFVKMFRHQVLGVANVLLRVLAVRVRILGFRL